MTELVLTAGVSKQRCGSRLILWSVSTLKYRLFHSSVRGLFEAAGIDSDKIKNGTVVRIKVEGP